MEKRFSLKITLALAKVMLNFFPSVYLLTSLTNVSVDAHSVDCDQTSLNRLTKMLLNILADDVVVLGALRTGFEYSFSHCVSTIRFIDVNTDLNNSKTGSS